MIDSFESEFCAPDQGNNGSRVLVASSENLPIPDTSIDAVLTSPPYCTRIDYAVATAAELAVLGYGRKSGFVDFRRGLIGTSTVPKSVGSPSIDWGQSCNEFLDQLRIHPSKASSTYYYKSHLQYFQGIHQSLQEISRTLKEEGVCVLVVQDSHYKDIHNDLPRIIVEMTHGSGLELKERSDFPLRRSMATVNPRVRKYRKDPSAIESVLCFKKVGSKSGEEYAGD
jgi:tRNA G10  N-methylase Trm11